MTASMSAISNSSHHRTHHRLAGIALIVVMAAGCLVLWIGIPAGSMWLTSKLTENAGEHFVLALLMTLVGMTLMATVLAYVNWLYLRVTGIVRREPGDPPWRLRGPLEPLLAWSFAIALGALFVWFFLFAENPSSQVI